MYTDNPEGIKGPGNLATHSAILLSCTQTSNITMTTILPFFCASAVLNSGLKAQLYRELFRFFETAEYNFFDTRCALTDKMIVHYAIEVDNVAMLRVCFNRMSDIFVRDSRGNTLLMYAVSVGALECAQVLQQRYPDRYRRWRNVFGDTALHFLVEAPRHPDTFAFLDFDDMMYMENRVHHNAFVHSLWRLRVDLAQYFLDRGYDVNRLCDTGYAPMHIVCLKWPLSKTHTGISMVKWLHSRGASMRTVSKDGRTPLMCCAATSSPLLATVRHLSELKSPIHTDDTSARE